MYMAISYHFLTETNYTAGRISIYQQILFFFLNRPFFPLGFGYRLRFLLRLLSLLVFLTVSHVQAKAFSIVYLFYTQKLINWDTGWGPALIKGGQYKGTFGGGQAQPSARPWDLLISSLGLTVLPPLSVRLSLSLSCTRVLPYLLLYRPLPLTLLCDLCSACLLPTVHPGNMPYS